MATKKITKAGTYDITINSKSKDTVFDISNKVANGTTLNFTTSSGYGNILFEKKGKDLIIKWCLDNKLVTSTIKNYYKYYNNNSNILKFYDSSVSPIQIDSSMSHKRNVNGYVNYKYEGFYNEYFNKKGSTYYNMVTTNEAYDSIVDLAGNDTYNIWNQPSYYQLYVYDYAGKDKYKVNYNSKAYINDVKGNDSYELFYGTKSTVNDYAGNDKYKLNYNYSTTINDKKGNDVYNSSFLCGSSVINDNAGNDKYNINSNYYYLEIEDKAGNDKYIMKGIGSDVEIEDYKGKDNYNISNIYNEIDIEDYAGDDKYNISDAYYELYIYDTKGKDTYNVKNTYYANICDYEGDDTYKIKDNSYYFSIKDGEYGSKKGGNDKYNVSNFFYDDCHDFYDYYGNEKYNLSNGRHVHIDDYQGKDSYVANNVYYLDIEDQGKQSDTYKISNSSYVEIEDYSGNETYNLNNIFMYSDYYCGYIEDYDGKDTYNVTNSYVYFYDYGKDSDKYKVNKLNGMLDINDDGGKDSLIISSANKKNLVFMTNYTHQGAGVYADSSYSLIIYDKVNKGYAKIDNFYDEGLEGSYLGYGAGRIETIKAGKAVLKGVPNGSYFSNSVKSAVSAWLSDNTSFNSVTDVLQKGSDSQIAQIISLFSGEPYLY